MAKALIGYLNSDLRVPAPLSVENSRLRARVTDLEALVLHLSQENDRLLAAQLLEESLHHEHDQLDSHLQPA